MGTVLSEEDTKQQSIFDFVQGITALARNKTHQDTRLELGQETVGARRLTERAARQLTPRGSPSA